MFSSYEIVIGFEPTTLVIKLERRPPDQALTLRHVIVVATEELELGHDVVTVVPLRVRLSGHWAGRVHDVAEGQLGRDHRRVQEGQLKVGGALILGPVRERPEPLEGRRRADEVRHLEGDCSELDDDAVIRVLRRGRPPDAVDD